MNGYDFPLNGTRLVALGSGALWWEEARMLCVSDLHLGKSERIVRRGGTMLPPYETRETLARLAGDIAASDPAMIVCLGDSFDDTAAIDGLPEAERAMIGELMAGRDWVWIAGNHDPVPQGLGGRVEPELAAGPLILRHIARPGALGELSGHYHPKARLGLGGMSITRPCFLFDETRAILPAYGAYTGGLDWLSPVLTGLMPGQVCAILTGTVPHAVPRPVPGRKRTRSRAG